MSSLNNEKVGVLCIFKRTYIFWLVLGSKKKQILAISTYDLKTCNWIKRILQGEYKQKKKKWLSRHKKNGGLPLLQENDAVQNVETIYFDRVVEKKNSRTDR